MSSSSSDIALSRALHSRVQHSPWSAAAGASEQHTVAWLGSAELYSMPGDHAARLGLGSGACAALSHRLPEKELLDSQTSNLKC